MLAFSNTVLLERAPFSVLERSIIVILVLLAAFHSQQAVVSFPQLGQLLLVIAPETVLKDNDRCCCSF
eukprot:2739918-Amphidinium_carterae.1